MELQNNTPSQNQDNQNNGMNHPHTFRPQNNTQQPSPSQQNQAQQPINRVDNFRQNPQTTNNQNLQNNQRPNNQQNRQPVKPRSKKIFSISGITMSEKVFLAKHMATIIKSGISLPEGLKVMEGQAKGTLKKVLQNVIIEVESGKSLNVALSQYEQYFDALFINMIKIGEKSGSLEQCLGYLAKQLEKDAKLVAKVRGASLYPTIVLASAVAVGGGISYFILPKLSKLFSVFQSQLPFATKILISISGSLEHHGLIWLGGIVALIILFLILRRNSYVKAQASRVILHMPVFGKLSKSLNLARFSLTLGTLLKSGVNIVEALEITEEAIGSLPYQKALQKVRASVNSGKSISESIIVIDPKEKLFPGTVKAMISVGERTGSLHRSLLYISQFYEEEVDTITKNLATSLEPILLVIIGLIVAFVAIAIVSPMYQLLGSISR